MASTRPVVTVLEQSRVAPPPGTVPDISLPLTFFDTVFWNFTPIQELLLYEFPHPKTHFIESIIPKLKESLSLTLKHFAPVAGNLLYPSPSSGKPEIQYVQGDSIPLTFAESGDNFNYLVGNHERDADRFYNLFPHMPPASIECNHTTRTPLFAVQVTVFPNAGFCIAISYRHVVWDGSTFGGFMWTWASIGKLGGDTQLSLANNSWRPLFDRAVIEDPFNLANAIFNTIKTLVPKERLPATATLSKDKVRATFEMSRDDIQTLKNFVLGRRPDAVHASVFTVTCAFIWTCWLKSLDAATSDINKPEYFCFPVDCRGRWDPPIPTSYFGNCLMPCMARSTRGELIGAEGLLIAADLIEEAIQKTIHNKEGILNGSLLYEVLGSLSGKRPLSVTGSPTFDVYVTDSGWGIPKKYESFTIDASGAISLHKSRKFEGGMEVGLSLPKNRMDAFATIFNNGLRVLKLSSKL